MNDEDIIKEANKQASAVELEKVYQQCIKLLPYFMIGSLLALIAALFKALTD